MGEVEVMLSPEEVARREEELAKRRETKRLYRQRRMYLFGALIILGIILMGLSAYFSYRQGLPVSGNALPAEDSRINVLFVGADETINASSRADTIMLVSLDPETGDVGVLSIPRDTRVFIAERQRWDRINAAYAYGGVNLVSSAVSDLLGIPIDYYVETDFNGFKDIVDTLEGVEIHIEREMYYVDNAQGLSIHLMPGMQRLDGDKARQYVRFRDRLGDVSLIDPVNTTYAGRVERQRQFVAALSRQILSPRTIPKLPRLISQIWKSVESNLPWEKVLSLTLSSSKFTADKVATAVLPGTGGTINGASYWLVDEQQAKRVVDSVLRGKPAPLTIQVLNGNGQAGIATSAARIIREQGFEVRSLGNADHYNYPLTQVIVYDSAQQDRVAGLAEILDASVVISDSQGSNVDVTVIIGRNYSI